MIDFNEQPLHQTGGGITLDEAARAACEQTGVIYQGKPVDGGFHALDVADKSPRNGAGRIRLYADGEGGQVWNHVTGGTLQFWAKSDQTFTPAELAERRQRAKAERERAEALLIEERAASAALAAKVWEIATPTANSVYFTRKQVTPTDTVKEIRLDELVKMIGYRPAAKGRELTGGMVQIIPVSDGAKITSIEMIDSNGLKSGLRGGLKKGCFWATHRLPAADTAGLVIGIGEGVATMLTYHMASGNIGIAALSCGNLEAVALSFRNHYPAARIEIVADVGNGEQSAVEAAMAVSGWLIKPTFAADSTGTDINDLLTESDLQAVKDCIQQARQVESTVTVDRMPVSAPDAATSCPSTETDSTKAEKCFPLKSGRDLRAMNIVVEWVVESLIPRNSVVLLYGRGGIGKTTLAMMLADAIDRGAPIFGMNTVRTAVIIVDYENSLAVLSERAKRTDIDGVLFWDSSKTPPSLDKPEWTIYMELLEQYPGAVLVFDTLRSSHSGDENNSEVMTLIMRRMRLLRDAGATVILLHHTPKSNDRQFKGSGAIFDLCDQTLALYQTAKPGSEQEAADDDDDSVKTYRFGTGKKTRYKPHRVFLSFDAKQELFVMAKNPDDEVMEYLRGIISEISRCSAPKQTEIITRALDDGEHNLTEKKIRAYLKKGTGQFWTTEKGLQHSIIYRPIESGNSADLYSVAELPNGTHYGNQSGKPYEKQGSVNSTQTSINTGFGKTAEGNYRIAELPETIPVFTEEDFEGVLL